MRNCDRAEISTTYIISEVDEAVIDYEGILIEFFGEQGETGTSPSCSELSNTP